MPRIFMKFKLRRGANRKTPVTRAYLKRWLSGGKAGLIRTHRTHTHSHTHTHTHTHAHTHTHTHIHTFTHTHTHTHTHKCQEQCGIRSGISLEGQEDHRV